MSEEDPGEQSLAASTQVQRRSLPAGYRQGIITAITALLGFSLTFLR